MTNDISKRTGGLSHWQVQLFIPSALCTEHIIIIIIIIYFIFYFLKNKHLEQGFGYRGIVCPLDQGKPLVSKR